MNSLTTSWATEPQRSALSSDSNTAADEPATWATFPRSFPTQCWYPVARSNEVTVQPLGRRVLDTNLCLWRTGEAGSLVVMSDRCPHRHLPLSMGTVVAGSIQCAYHGLRFSGGGRCVRVPGQARVPPGCDVRTYRVEEQDHLIWVWLAKEPPVAPPPAVPGDNGCPYVVVQGTMHANCRPQLMNENLLDLSHATFLHSESIGTEEIAETKPTTSHTSDSVKVVRFMEKTRIAPIHSKLLGITGTVARSQSAEWIAPALHVTTIENIAPDGQRYRHRVVSCICPESDSSLHYLWLVLREYLLESEEADRTWSDGLPVVIQQDIDAVEAIERQLSAAARPAEINLSIDAGPLRSRRIVNRMVANERAGSGIEKG